jgi:hypothetical protein
MRNTNRRFPAPLNALLLTVPIAALIFTIGNSLAHYLGEPTRDCRPRAGIGAASTMPTLCNRSLAGLRLSGFLVRFDAIHV